LGRIVDDCRQEEGAQIVAEPVRVLGDAAAAGTEILGCPFLTSASFPSARPPRFALQGTTTHQPQAA